MIRNFKKLILSIFEAHRLKNKPLDVRQERGVYSYNPMEDESWLAYSKARNEIMEWPHLSKLLSWIKLI